MKKKVGVIGAGIIGLYVASELKKKSFDVTVFEKQSIEKVGKKSCSTLVSKRIFDFIQIDDDLIENTIKRCLIKFKKKEVVLEFNPEHIVINRERFVLRMIKNAEFNIIFESNRTDFSEFDYVIGADGASSFLRHKLNLKNPGYRVGLKVESNVKDSNDTVKTFKTKNGFTWIIPKGNYTEYGVLEKKENIKDEWKKFNKKGSNLSFALVPQGLVLASSDKYAIVGDATGLTKPWSGGGIIWQLYEAKMLIENFPNFKKYNKEVRKFFLWKIIKGRISNKLIHFVGNHFSFLIPSYIKYDNDFPNFFKSLLNSKRKKPSS
ncbi:MAG: NAD(P)/FAD-dependent oxidoreductase [Candidatus Pacebacteria bacterium]|nr:NAD(P)/FAD-dependent oxidoreductase [Candidatus Paceibacterota bacterium]